MPTCEGCGHDASSHDNPAAGTDTYCDKCRAYHTYYPKDRKGVLGRLRA